MTPLALALALAAVPLAQARVAVVRPGGGLLVADGTSVVPLDVVLQGQTPALRSVRVAASTGAALRAELISSDRARFLLPMPGNEALIELTLDLLFADGTRRTEIYPLVLPRPRGPELKLDVTPGAVPVLGQEPVTVRVAAIGDGLIGLDAATDLGRLELGTAAGGMAARSREGPLALPFDLPPDAPSHAQLVAAATGVGGWAVATGSLAVVAPVRIRADVPRGWRLGVEGAETEVASVAAPADGYTTLEAVPIRYGAPVRVVQRRGRKRLELAVPLPVGRISPGVVLALPDQAWADGGTGPTLAVAIPPSPFGSRPSFPEVQLEGARLVAVVPAGPQVAVLVIDRPQDPKPVRVLLDGLPAGAVAFRAPRGHAVEVQPAPAGADERAAAMILVHAGDGTPASVPVPRVRWAGSAVEPVFVDAGQWRVHLPAGTPGAPGDRVELVAELPAPPLVVGDALDLPRASVEVELVGLPPALRAEVEPAPGPPPAGPGIGLEPWAAGFGGSTFGGLAGGGVAAGLELALPPLERRFGLRLGFEVGHAVSAGETRFGADAVPSQAAVTGVLIPLEAAFVALRAGKTSLRLRAGAALRYEGGSLTVENLPAGGQARLGVGLRAGLEATVPIARRLGLTLGAVASGIGASAEGFSSENARFEGSLFGLRGEVGLRWLGE